MISFMMSNMLCRNVIMSHVARDSKSSCVGGAVVHLILRGDSKSIWYSGARLIISALSQNQTLLVGGAVVLLISRGNSKSIWYSGAGLIILTLTYVGGAIFHIRGGGIAGSKIVSNSIRGGKILMNVASVSSHCNEYEELIFFVVGGDSPKISRACQMPILLLFTWMLSSTDVSIFPLFHLTTISFFLTLWSLIFLDVPFFVPMIKDGGRIGLMSGGFGKGLGQAPLGPNQATYSSCPVFFRYP